MKWRKDLATQISDNIYNEQRIEDVYLERNLDEVDEAIKDLLEKNSNLQEEVKKLKKEQEIQSVRLCEVMEEGKKTKEVIKEKNNVKFSNYPLNKKTSLINLVMQIKSSWI